MAPYVQLDSWHEVDLGGAETDGGAITAHPSVTRCGLEIPAGAPTSTTLPLEEKSCESCLRLARHDSESTEPVDGP